MNNSGACSNEGSHGVSKHSRNEVSIEIESDSSNLNLDQSRILNQSNNKYELSGKKKSLVTNSLPLVKDSQRLKQMIEQQHQSR